MKNKTCGKRLMVFDFDGTLSNLVQNRHGAYLHTESLGLLEELVAEPQNQVAVLSSRALDDLIDRVPIPKVLLGGGSGLEWHLPGGKRISPGLAKQKKLNDARERVLPILKWIGAFPGVELEDKRWSVSVHYRQVPPEKLAQLLPVLAVLDRLQNIRLFEGPFVTEVQFLSMGNKYFGIKRLCQLLKFNPSEGEILYAGDDENDAAAMRWVLSRKGKVFIVGGRVQVAGARHVNEPALLAQAVRAINIETGKGGLEVRDAA